jgi:dipeptidyl aminopeptidase/acylaminoacyl peptidase
MVGAGATDRTVIPSQRRLPHEALRRAGVESILHLAPGAGHGGRGFNAPEIREMILKFLARHLAR